ncbi:MAG: DUF4147 domain-containing protein [Pseudomonadota bacterium]
MTDITDLRRMAHDAFLAGVAAADPNAAVQKALRDMPDLMKDAERVYLLSVGKAALGMAEAALSLVGQGTFTRAIAVTNYENERALDGVEVYAAAHPVPDEEGARAAAAVEAMLAKTGPGDLVFCCISGGSSALLPAPVDDLDLEDKIAVNAILLSSGLEIQEMNLVRQSLSRLKGGGILRQAAPARVVSFILSDVLGDDLRAIGSGPSVGPVGPISQARALMQSRGLWAALPGRVQKALQRPDEPISTEPIEAYLVGSNALSLAAMAKIASASISRPDLIGDVQVAAERVVGEAMVAGPAARLAFGGETTVTLKGSGRGGRNQELALRVARAAERAGLTGPWCFLSGGTDGRDGPTDAAGGIVDHTTLQRLQARGIDTEKLLANNDSYAILDAAGDLLMTGATGTNVADLQLFLRGR